MARKPAEFIDHPMTFPSPLEARAFCRYVVDGDTMDVLVDLGMGKYAYETIRLKDVNCWEIYGGADVEEKIRGQAAKAFVEELILDKPVKIRTYKDAMTFGRYVADIFYWDINRWWVDLAEELRAAGHEKV